ncbi:hypothetical protein [Priestia megaterium]|uniref:hypothetical protein n=1 Tax=Priestia megaterium TaxID=1404 RepID=UPI0030026782
MRTYEPRRLVCYIEEEVYGVDVWEVEGFGKEKWHATANRIDSVYTYSSFTLAESEEEAIEKAIDDVKVKITELEEKEKSKRP